MWSYTANVGVILVFADIVYKPSLPAVLCLHVIYGRFRPFGRRPLPTSLGGVQMVAGETASLLSKEQRSDTAGAEAGRGLAGGELSARV